MRSRSSPLLFFSIMIVLLLLVGVGGLWWWNDQRTEARQLVYTIPQGTMDRVIAGEDVTVLPDTINLTVGHKDILIIHNEDTQPIDIGTFRLAPGQQYRQQFFNPGTFELLCSVHADQQLRIEVQ
ncbi:MAG: hypothetical protein GFH27_549333n110 [Chloroflexi bacterium AL-W]|nr:hypothetical protein [Chloroflexi bacterium AL-N1]NOK70437.1 hypothetical protein [Chloroflexi bacterium AL-N10]NOK78204.1 hypothetical protein [Chloroflexi bacterium AL-N5]NOK85303.1 hypothetical protein [Chloroflexi bacterium AL-W]NOK92068.1 hypothetical protein [Chloroflexi bacterium AL-N15]